MDVCPTGNSNGIKIEAPDVSASWSFGQDKVALKQPDREVA